MGAYIARNAICSAVASPLPVELDVSVDEGASLSPFETRMVETDLHKGWLQTLRQDKSDALIIDLIDERFSVIEYGGGRATESASLVKTRAHKQLEALPIARLDFLSRRAVDERAIDAFAALVSGLGKQVFIHRALWATHFIADGQAPAEFEKSAYYNRMNDQLFGRYEKLKVAMPHARAIDVPARLRIAVADHRWGLAPFHFGPDYYQFVRSELGLD